MNLVQIQERLKDMPLQAVMQYANGMNPEVPPYLALGELNRRKKMEQSMQPAEMPQGTVKEQLEQEVGLAALQKQLLNQLQTQGLRQQQAAMSQGQQMARMPGPAPQGVPQPEVPEEVEMAGGGIATINVPDNQFEFGSGGIIAFKNGGLNPEFITDAFDGMEVEPSERQKRRADIDEAERLRREEIRDRAERQKRAEQQAEQIEFLKRADVPVDMVKAVQEGRVLTTNPITPDRGFPDNRGSAQRFPPGPPPAAAAPMPAPARQPVAQAAAPQGIAAVAPIPQSQAVQALAQMIPQAGTQAVIKDYETERAEAAKKDPYLNKRPGEKLEQYLSTLERRDREDQERFQRMEQERTRAALWKSLIAAGEASRGQKGIGALLGGFGRTAGDELEAGRVREEKQALLMRERESNRVKMMQEIETARIAASKGDFAAKREADMNAAKFQQKDREITGQLVTNLAQIEAANARSFAELQQQAAEGKLNRETQIIVANISAASANRPGEAERIFEEYQRRLKADPSGKMAQEYMDNIQKIKGTYTRGENTRISGLKNEAEEIRKVLSDPILISKLPKNEVERLRKRLPEVISQIGMAEPGAKKEAGKIYLD